MGHKEALAEIHKGAGTHFDPDLARTFLEVITEEDEFFGGTNYQLGGYQKAS
jgi:HD-GYP domain-containing protein (c-di-GMP phosphodiesterase class II)